MGVASFLQKLNYLLSDFVGFSINPFGILRFFEIVGITLFLMALCYLVGNKLIGFFIEKNDKSWQRHFYSFGLGYILIGTGVLILGMFSLINIGVFSAYFFYLTFFAFRKSNLAFLFKSLKKLVIGAFSNFTFEKIIFIAIIVSVFLRLLPPEIGPDALDYHTGYPKVYTTTHTMMLLPLGDLGNVAIPQLSEMYYTVVTLFGLVEATKYIHFFFFCLIGIFLWYMSKNSKQEVIFKYASLLFISSPLVIHIAPSAYGDLQAVYLFLLSVVLLVQKNLNKRIIFLSGVSFGGVLATKMFGLEFFPIMIFYIVVRFWKKWGKILRYILIFTFASLGVLALWLFHSFLLTKKFIYFADTGKPNTDVIYKLLNQMIFSGPFTNIINNLLINFSPLFFLGLIVLIFIPKTTFSYLKRFPILFLGFILLVYITIFYLNSSQRYFLQAFSVVVLVSSVGLSLIAKNRIMHLLIHMALIVLALYYFANSLLILPYGLGWLNVSSYLTRQFLTDKSQYYDFGQSFSSKIGSGETVVTFGIWGHYYLNQDHINAYYFIETDKRHFFEQMKSKNIHKILIRGGDINWFCQKLGIISQCGKRDFILLASFPLANQYLYEASY